MKALMQTSPLHVNQILDYAATWHGEQEVVSRMCEGHVLISSYAEVHRRAQLCSVALSNLGLGWVGESQPSMMQLSGRTFGDTANGVSRGTWWCAMWRCR